KQLAGTIDLELSYARKRQYDQFLSATDATGHSSTTYVYRTVPRPAAAAPLESSGSSSDTMGWIALAVLLAAALPVAAVFWARSQPGSPSTAFAEARWGVGGGRRG